MYGALLAFEGSAGRSVRARGVEWVFGLARVVPCVLQAVFWGVGIEWDMFAFGVPLLLGLPPGPWLPHGVHPA